MIRFASGILVLLLVLPVAADAQDTKQKPATPAEEYQALLKEAETAQLSFIKALSDATDENRGTVIKEKAPNLGPKFLALAEKYPQDPVALDALIWVMTDNFGAREGKDLIIAKAIGILLRDHIKSDKLGRVCEQLGEEYIPGDSTAFLTTVLEKSPHKEVQAEAALALAYQPLQRARLAEMLKKDPDAAKQLTEAFGKERIDALQKAEVDKLQSESDKLFRSFAEKYSGVLSPKRLARICLLLSYNSDKLSEAVLRSLLAKDPRPAIQGPATLGLAKLLATRADTVVEKDAKEAAKMWAETDSLLERAVEKYADMELEFYGSVGKQAKKELFSLRNLSIGKVAPDIEGEDQLGKRFSLGDYRGKVVLLDFWSQH
jgi:AhpC/TSA family